MPTRHEQSQCRVKKDEISNNWEALQAKAAARKKKLDDSHDLQQYLNDYRDAVSWISDMKQLILAEDVATVQDVLGAQMLCQRHQERKGEIDARQESFDRVLDVGRKLMDAQHYASEELQSKNDSLVSDRRELSTLWEQCDEEFEDCHDLQLFEREATEAESWIMSNTAVAHSDDLGDSMDDVEVLLKKFDDFEKSMAAQVEKTKKLDRLAETFTEKRANRRKGLNPSPE
eukprot:m.106120 g.106120  ORF g.106120 m.106120 type:complete len:230 (+) comp22524_c0_seq1:1299-1988(+)